ncbi:MAG: penicillin-binding protein 2 [Deltaproteobacteria bacterium]|nr:penicillin-binding protein 2 [Deltaproteobacteria bacterium]
MEIAGQNAELPEIRRRTRYFALLVLLVFGALGTRLFFLQVLEGDSFYRVTADSVIRTEILPALRGEIRDHRGRVLASTRPAYNVEVVPSRLDRATYTQLLKILADHDEDLPDWDTFLARVGDKKDRPFIVATDVSRETMAQLETSMDSRGVTVRTEARRFYPNGPLAANTLGYLNEVSAEELRTLKDEGYRPGDLAGRTGLEKQWEPYLRGRKGLRKYVVPRRGIDPSTIAISDLVSGPTEVAPVPGENLVLTLDLDVQKAAERSLAQYRAAAAVVLDVKTGRILAMVSRPGYDPNSMSGSLSSEAAARLFSDPFRPLRDRCLSDTFNPGSTFKAISAISAIEEGVITAEERTKCYQFVQVGRRRFRCTKAHGIVNLQQAIIQSCNVFFYELAMRPGMMGHLSHYAAMLGLGVPTGLGLNGEQAGFVPTEEWHRQQEPTSSQQGFMIGHALNTAIGEGATRVTPMQMALVYATIAADGVLWLPQIIERIETNDGRVVEEFEPRVRSHLTIGADTLNIVRKALVGVVNNPKGTAYKARSNKVTVAGKTGTAQANQMRNVKTGELPPIYARQDHAWFAGFAPAEAPQIAFAVLVEHGGHGGDVAAPAAIAIAERYMELKAEREAADNKVLPVRPSAAPTPPAAAAPNGATAAEGPPPRRLSP